MYPYTIIQWLFFFYFYCFLGWCVESFYVSAKSRKLINRGFMRGPFLPLYGSGAIMMLLVSMPFQDNLFFVYIAGCIGATALEYVTGVAMEALFQVRYWDYSQNKFNFQGHICLFTSLAWGGLTIFMTEIVHRPIEKMVLSMPQPLLKGMVCALTAEIAVDFTLSFKAALDLRDVLARMEKAREELRHIRSRLDVLLTAVMELHEDVHGFAREALRGESHGSTFWEARLASLGAGKLESRLPGIRKELQELRARYLKLAQERKRLGALKGFFQKELLRAHPSMRSVRFKEALEELKQNLSR